MNETDTSAQTTTEEQSSPVLSGWKIVVSLVVAAALVLLTGTALFGDFGMASAALVRAQSAVTAAEEKEEALSFTAVYEDDAPVAEKAGEEKTFYDPHLYLEAAREISVYDGELEEAYIAAQEAAAEEAAAQAAWYQTPLYEEAAYSAPAQDACIGDGLTY